MSWGGTEWERKGEAEASRGTAGGGGSGGKATAKPAAPGLRPERPTWPGRSLQRPQSRAWAAERARSGGAHAGARRRASCQAPRCGPPLWRAQRRRARSRARWRPACWRTFLRRGGAAEGGAETVDADGVSSAVQPASREQQARSWPSRDLNLSGRPAAAAAAISAPLCTSLVHCGTPAPLVTQRSRRFEPLSGRHTAPRLMQPNISSFFKPQARAVKRSGRGGSSPQVGAGEAAVQAEAGGEAAAAPAATPAPPPPPPAPASGAVVQQQFARKRKR